jgi:CDGSH-type Zn-finger protein
VTDRAKLPLRHMHVVAFARGREYVRKRAPDGARLLALLSIHGPFDGIPVMAEVKIVTRENGPLLITGPITLVDHEGTAFNLGGKETIALCRCGASANKPFCDGSHKNCGFVAAVKATP